MKLIALFVSALLSLPMFGQQDLFPDGTPIPEWFRQNEIVNIRDLGTAYNLADYGVVNDSTVLQTEKIQAVIDRAAEQGGVVIVPKGTYLTGALFFKPRTHLHLEEGATLKGSDDISNFPIVDTRIEGQTVKYFSALINADKVNGFTISGSGTINGNGLRYWKSFWLRRQWNPKCTNMDEMRPRLVYISNSNDVQLSGVRFINSPFWTTHLYRCNNVKLLGLHIFAPAAPVKAPSSDAVDVDACTNVLIKGCYMSVNDDAVALKGGKGPQADKDPNNGGNRNVIIEDCTYGFCHSGLTCGSESIHNHNQHHPAPLHHHASQPHPVVENASRHSATLQLHHGRRRERRRQKLYPGTPVDTVFRLERTERDAKVVCRSGDDAQHHPEVQHVLRRRRFRPI